MVTTAVFVNNLNELEVKDKIAALGKILNRIPNMETCQFHFGRLISAPFLESSALVNCNTRASVLFPSVEIYLPKKS